MCRQPDQPNLSLSSFLQLNTSGPPPPETVCSFLYFWSWALKNLFFFQTSPCSLASTSFLGGTLQFGGQVAVWKKMPCNTLEWSSSRPSTVNIALAAGDWFLTVTFRKKVSTFCSHITAASCPEEMSLAYPSAQMGTRPVWLGSLFDFLLDFSCVLSCFFHVCNAQPSPLSIHCVCSHMSGGRALS